MSFQESEWVIKWYSWRLWESWRPQSGPGHFWIMGIVLSWELKKWIEPSPFSCPLSLLSNTENYQTHSLFSTPNSPSSVSVVHVIDTDVYLRHSWHPHVLPVTLSRMSRASCAHVVTNTDKMSPDTRSNIPMSVFVVVWGKMPSDQCTMGNQQDTMHMFSGGFF